MKTCSCGNILKGFDKVRGSYCSECISKDTDERQKRLLEEETKELYALAIAAKERGETKFKYGKMCYYKITKKGFYGYAIFKIEFLYISANLSASMDGTSSVVSPSYLKD